MASKKIISFFAHVPKGVFDACFMPGDIVPQDECNLTQDQLDNLVAQGAIVIGEAGVSLPVQEDENVLEEDPLVVKASPSKESG